LKTIISTSGEIKLSSAWCMFGVQCYSGLTNAIIYTSSCEVYQKQGIPKISNTFR